jgi:hypothetical protein
LRQKIYYIEHKKKHKIKYQKIIIPDDLIIYFKNSFKDRLNNISILRESEFKKKFEKVYISKKENENFLLYGDKTYINLIKIISPFPRKSPEKYQRQFNKRIEKARVAVKNIFSQI